MRTRSAALIATLLFLSACGGGAGRTPTSPSTAISVAAGQPTGQHTAGSVSWSCFTSTTGNPFGPAGCASASQTTSRVLPSAASPLNAPNGPTNLSANVSGSVVTLNWI